MDILKRIDSIAGAILRWGSTSILAVLFVLLAANVFVRFVPVVSFGWFDEIIEMLIAWLVFLGAAALWRDNEHFTVAFLPDHFKGTRSGYLLDILVNIISLTFLAVFTYYSYKLTLRAADWTPVINMPKKLLYVSMPVSGAVMIAYSLRNITRSVLRLQRSGDVISENTRSGGT